MTVVTVSVVTLTLVPAVNALVCPLATGESQPGPTGSTGSAGGRVEHPDQDTLLGVQKKRSDINLNLPLTFIFLCGIV